MRKLARSALLGAMATGIIAGVAKAHTSHAEFYFEFSGTHSTNDMITVPCEASDYLAKQSVEYNLDPNKPSPMGNNTGVFIKYKPANQLNNADNIVFTLKNAVFGNSLKKCWLVFYEHNGIDTTGNGVGDTSFDVNRDGDAYDMIVVAETRNTVQLKKSIELNVGDAGRGIPANAIYYLWCNEAGEPSLIDADGTAGSPQIPSNYSRYAPVINITSDLYDSDTTDTCKLSDPGDKVCISATGYTCCPPGSGELDGYKTIKDYCIIDTACQFILGMKASLSIIDMYPQLNTATCENSKSGLIKCYDKNYEPGTAFVPVGDDNDILRTNHCTDRYAADGTISILNDPRNLVDDDIVLGVNKWRGTFSVSISDVDNNYACDNRNGRGFRKGPYEALDFPNRMFIDNNGNPTSPAAAHIPLNPGRACSAENINVVNGDPNTGTTNTIKIRRDSVWTDDVYMGVNKKRLWWVRWGLEEELKIYSPDNDTFTVSLNEEEAAKCDTRKCCYDADGTAYFKKWEPNGDEAYIPYMIDDSQFYIVISNNSCWDAEIYARVWDSAGRVVDNVYLGKIGKNSVRFITGASIAFEARKEHPQILRNIIPLYSVMLTIGAPKRDVEIAAYDNRNGKSKMVPVYDNGAHHWSYRNVPFNQDIFEK